MGGSSSTQYPASTLGGLWSQQNAEYGPYMQNNTAGSGLTNAFSGTGAIKPTADFAGASQQALNTAFDPQKAIYAQQFQKQQDQNLASQAMAGVAATPYGAGLSQQGNQNFDIAWQQAQLANQAQGVGTAAAAQNAALNPQQQQIQDYLNYAAQNLQGVNSYWNSALGSLGGTNSLYGTQGSINNAQNQQFGQSLSGLGSLLGGVAGAGSYGYGPLSFLSGAAVL